jgi:hypothetical protein
VIAGSSPVALAKNKTGLPHWRNEWPSPEHWLAVETVENRRSGLLRPPWLPGFGAAGRIRLGDSAEPRLVGRQGHAGPGPSGDVRRNFYRDAQSGTASDTGKAIPAGRQARGHQGGHWSGEDGSGPRDRREAAASRFRGYNRGYNHAAESDRGKKKAKQEEPQVKVLWLFTLARATGLEPAITGSAVRYSWRSSTFRPRQGKQVLAYLSACIESWRHDGDPPGLVPNTS